MTDDYEKRAAQFVEVELNADWIPRTAPVPAPPPRDFFAEIMAECPQLVPMGESAWNADDMSWAASDLTREQRDQIAAAMAQAWRDWAEQ